MTGTSCREEPVNRADGCRGAQPGSLHPDVHPLAAREVPRRGYGVDVAALGAGGLAVSYSRGSIPIRRAQWEIACHWLEPNDPIRRAKFGRYVGALGGTLTAVCSGREAWVAHLRERGQEGFSNRAYRRALTAYLLKGGAPSGLLLFQP